MQRYLWQQAEGRRHAYDTARNPSPRAGESFTALCGQTVAPAPEDMIAGLWLAPTCHACEFQLAARVGWSRSELHRLRISQEGSTA
ncbi:zinc finger protein [Saccharomonospora cyanea]|uniref:Zinc-finger domain-containing protein n=1 Tax=Saccharomonospora cyanea NA-134 TaxID=882082 RepID=H5XHB5_9PSEU|nr:zinc finger protein [Saccharomonospora cyanea]EHR60600.1 hypothetical protein SaccyDRAFT_1702 [Saccharomonospora cyanea NA-134]